MADAHSVAQGSGSDRAAVLADLAKATAEQTADEPSQAAAPSEESPPDPSLTDDEARPAAPSDEEPAEPKVEAAPDAETAKRLATVQRQEKRLREQLAKEKADAKAELDDAQRRIEAEWGPRVKAAQEFEALKARARRDPAAALAALGIDEDMYETAAQQLYALSKAGQADPKRRAHAEQLLRDREREDKLTATERRIAELEQKLTAKEQAQQAAAEAERYLGTITKSVTDDAPLVKTMLTKNAAKAEARLARVAMELLEQTGETPDPGDVIAALEKQRREELDELGIDYQAPTKKTVAPVTARPGKTLGTSGGPSVPKATAKDAKEERDAILRELDKLQPTND